MNPNGNDRLIGWKAIGSFLGKDARTARRWEAERGLPVRRVPGGGSASVWADRDELTEWMAGDAHRAAEPDDHHEPQPLPDRAQPWFTRRRWAVAAGIAMAAIATPMLLPAFSTSLAVTQPVLAPYGDATANAAYRDASYAMHRRSVEGLFEAERAFTALSRSHPRNPAAFVGIAETNLLLREFNSLPDETAYRRAAVAAEQALTLDRRSPGALRSLAFIKYWADGERVEGLALFRRALDAAPTDPQTLHWYGTALFGEGRFAESVTMLDRASAINPGSSAIAADTAYVRYVAGEHERAKRELLRVTRVDPAFSGAREYLSRIYLVEHEDAAFVEMAIETARLKRNNDRLALFTGARSALDQGGRRAMLDHLIADAQRAFAQNGAGAIDMARYQAAAGNREQVLTWLTRAESIRTPEIRSVVGYPDFVPYRNDPAFARFFPQR